MQNNIKLYKNLIFSDSETRKYSNKYTFFSKWNKLKSFLHIVTWLPLNLHTLLHTTKNNISPMEPKEDKMRKCPICSKAFPTKQRLRHHIFIHDPDAKLKCEVGEFTSLQNQPTMYNILNLFQTCGKIFKNSLRLKVHIGSLHTGIKFLGQICRKELSCSTSLRNHMDRIHSAKERPRYPCKFPDCTKSFLNKGHVSDHFKMEHAENPVRFPCFLCWKEFKTRPGLNLHISSHTKEKVYKCKICGKRFGQSPHLSRHEVIFLAYIKRS